jgi:predicted acyltransferase
VNLYSGFFLVTDPQRYYKYVPEWMRSFANVIASLDAYLRIQGIGEMMIAMCLLGWFFPRWCVRIAAILLTAEMMLILLFVGVDAVTFRNMGLVGAALALLSISYEEA